MAVPTLDAPLTEYGTNFQARGSAAPGDFSLSVGQMAQYTVLHDNWMAAYNAAKPEGAKSRALVRAKNDMKAILLPYLRQLYGIIKVSAAVTNENKTLIGVTI